MSAQFSINPVLTTNAQGTFQRDSQGYIQGTALPDPAIRNSLAGGVLASDETLPMWGGVGISESIPSLPSSANGALGGNIRRATLLTGSKALTGFSVFDQDHSMVNSPQSPVPLAASLMGVNFYRLGSGARIVVAIDPALVTLEGGLITQQVSWDFNGQRISDYVAAYPANVITNAVWSAGAITFTTTTGHGVLPGDSVSISGFTPSAYNGDYVAQVGTAGSTIVVLKAIDPGADTVQGQLDAGGGALPVIITDIQVANSMTVDYDPVTGFATWNRSGSTAIIRI